MMDTNPEPIPWARPAIDDEEMKEVIACMASGWLSSGPRVAQFEEAMAVRAGRKFAVAVTNGTSALDVALKSLRIGRGDEVIVPAFSYIATASSVAMQGATPVFCDIDRRNLGLDPMMAAAAISPRTAGIICTDYGGFPCDFTELGRLAQRHKIPLILDGAQSFGTQFRGRPSLSYGEVSTASFHAAKTLTTVEGGMVFTDDEALARRMRMIRSQGEDPKRKYYHIELGNNSRMTELQAAIGIAQLRKIDSILEQRRQVTAQYEVSLRQIGLAMPPGIPGGTSSYFLIPILLNDRDYVAARLKERGIETRVCYPIPLYSQPIMQQFHADPCTIAEEACAQVLDLPIFFGMTSEQQQRVIDELADAAQQQARSAA